MHGKIIMVNGVNPIYLVMDLNGLQCEALSTVLDLCNDKDILLLLCYPMSKQWLANT